MKKDNYKISLVRFKINNKDYIGFYNDIYNIGIDPYEWAYNCSDRTVITMFNKINGSDNSDDFKEFIKYSSKSETFDVRDLNLKKGIIYGYYIHDITYENNDKEYDIFYISNKKYHNSLHLLKDMGFENVVKTSKLVITIFNTNDFIFEVEGLVDDIDKISNEELSECDLNKITLLLFTYEDNEIGDIVDKIVFSTNDPRVNIDTYMEYAKTCMNQEIFSKFDINDDESLYQMKSYSVSLDELDIKEDDIIYGYYIPVVWYKNDSHKCNIMYISTKKYNDAKSLLKEIDKEYKNIFMRPEMLITKAHLKDFKYLKK